MRGSPRPIARSASCYLRLFKFQQEAHSVLPLRWGTTPTFSGIQARCSSRTGARRAQRRKTNQGCDSTLAPELWHPREVSCPNAKSIQSDGFKRQCLPDPLLGSYTAPGRSPVYSLFPQSPNSHIQSLSSESTSQPPLGPSVVVVDDTTRVRFQISCLNS